MIDLWTPCLTAVYTKPTGKDNQTGWLYPADDRWLEVLTSTAAALVIEFATQLVAAGSSLTLSTPAVRHIMRSYLTFPVGSAEFDETVREQLVIRKHASNVAVKEPSCFEPYLLPEEEDLVDGIFDTALLEDDPLVLHPREERQMDEDYFKIEAAQTLGLAMEEDALLEEHAFQTAILMQDHQIKYVKHDFLSF